MTASPLKRLAVLRLDSGSHWCRSVLWSASAPDSVPSTRMPMDLREQLQHTLGSTYTLERELGGGGMARVFVAQETRLRRSVAVKVLSPELAAGISGERFEREIQVAASLQQANIVPVLSAGDMDGVPYYTMPFVAGESLRSLLATRGPLPINEIVGILHDVARALSYAHARGVVHRDIKPDNVLLSHGTAVVTDFGIAKAISASRTAESLATLTQVGSTIGTPAYMAPEQAGGDPEIDHRADFYALGCMAYELLAGRPPFADLPPQRVLAAHLTETPQPVREIRADTPASLASLVTRCLAKRPADRPADANEILRALDGIATSSGDQSRVGSASRLWRGRRTVTMASAATVVALALVLAAAWWRGRGAGPAHVDRSIVVLPLANLSGDKSNDYFGEGLAEEITTALSKAGLRVIGQSTARRLVDRAFDAQTIARQLSVGSVLQGSVQPSGDSLRITVSLIAASDGSVMWIEHYYRGKKDVFSVQDEIAHSVAAQLRVTLAGGAGMTLVRKETNDPEAHALYLQGLYQWNRRTTQTLQLAISLFQQAVRRDSNYARAHAGIAMAYMVLPVYDDVPSDEIRSKAVDEARRALALDSTLPEAHTVLGYAHGVEFENASAEREFAEALRLDSSFATGHFWYSLLLAHLGRFDEGLREANRARVLEPASPIVVVEAAHQLYLARGYDAADSVERGVLALDSTFPMALFIRGRILTEQGRFDEATAILERLSRQPNLRSAEKLGVLAYAYARAGRKSQARATLARLRADTLVSVGGAVAAALDALGDHEAAVAMFKSAVAQHDPWLWTWGRSAAYDGLRKDPRLASLFAKIEAPQ